MRLRRAETSTKQVFAARTWWLTLLSTWLLACNDDALIRDYNDYPIAVAQVVRPGTGEIVEPLADGSLAPVTFRAQGGPVRVILRGENSRDPDGELQEYRWLSANRIPDAGTLMPPLRRVLAGVDSAWPADTANVTLDLEPGTWAFTLWVRDDQNAWSEPDTVRLVIESSAASDAGVAALRPSMDGGPPTLLR